MLSWGGPHTPSRGLERRVQEGTRALDLQVCTHLQPSREGGESQVPQGDPVRRCPRTLVFSLASSLRGHWLPSCQ